MGIVLELQKLALDGNSNTLELLRKAYFVARKLEIKDFQDWVKHELHGYYDYKNLPEYRIAYGSLEALNVYYGWQPVIISDIEDEKNWSRITFRESMPSLISLIESARGNMLSMGFDGKRAEYLCKMTEKETQFRLRISSHVIANIPEQIKNIILDWAMLLEENGILGEGLMFTVDEKKTAKEVSKIINYTNNFYGDVSRSQIQIGTTNSSQKIVD